MPCEKEEEEEYIIMKKNMCHADAREIRDFSTILMHFQKLLKEEGRSDFFNEYYSKMIEEKERCTGSTSGRQNKIVSK